VLLIVVWCAYEVGSLFSVANPRMFETLQPSSKSKHLNCNTALGSIVVDVDLGDCKKHLSYSV